MNKLIKPFDFGVYEIEGIEMNVRIPGTNKTTKTLVPIEHIAYNIVLPRVAKEIFKDYRRKISEYVRDVEVERKDPLFLKHKFLGGRYDKENKRIIISPHYLNPKYIGNILCGELGHALSTNEYGLPSKKDTPIHEYYDFLTSKLGETLLKNTKYGFEEKGIIDKAENEYKRLSKNIERAEKIKKELDEFYKKVMNKDIGVERARENLKRYEEPFDELDSEEAKYSSPSMTFNRQNIGYEHVRGYALAEFMYRTFGFKKSFTSPDKIFDANENLSQDIVDNLGENDKKIIKKLYEELDNIPKLRNELDKKIEQISFTLSTLTKLLFIYPYKLDEKFNFLL